MARASLLCLVLGAALLAAPAYAAIQSEIDGVKASCNASAPANVLSASDCRACVQTIGGQTPDSDMYACSAVCQKESLFPASPVQDPSKCVTCITNQVATVYGCQNCMEVHVNNVARREACFTCVQKRPLGLNPPDVNDAYEWGCAQCERFNGLANSGTAYDDCVACIAKPYEDPLPHDSTPTRVRDIGKCVFNANQTYLLNAGLLDLNGTIYGQCYPKGADLSTLPLSASKCVKCMTDSQNKLGVSPVYPVLAKDWACADYCQDPDYTGNVAGDVSVVGSAASKADECVQCVVSDYPKDAWACSACMATPNYKECFTCAKSDPYSGNVTGYNWACSMCAKIADADLRKMCFQCIQSQPGAGDGNTNEYTEANICSCVDLTQNQTIAVNRTLDAVERSCFEPFISHDSTGKEVIADIPWGNVTVGGNSGCLTCMKLAANTSSPHLNKRYACNQYCQDPKLVTSVQQGDDCAACVSDYAVSDPWGCQACMTATANTADRKDCFSCVQGDSKKFPNHAWGCSQCAQFTKNSDKAACYQCLSQDVFDPCTCVESVANGTLTLPPQGSGTQTACEHRFMTLQCEAPFVIKGVTGAFYGRSNPSTCVNDNGSCGIPGTPVFYNTCPVSDTTCSTDAQALAMARLASGHCINRPSCNVFNDDAQYVTDMSAFLLAENLPFPGLFTDDCVGTYKYLQLNLVCGLIADPVV